MAQPLKYLLCRPVGGLNDILCQIEKSWRYAEKYRRQLIVDTTRSYWHDDLFRYFELSEKPVIPVSGLTPDLLEMLNGLTSVFPVRLAGHLDGTVGESGTDQPFDYSRDHTAQLIVPDQYGGGRLGVFCLKRLRLRAEIAAKVIDRYPNLGSDYCAIHIRHTDLVTDYRAFLAAVAPWLAGEAVLVCSDNRACIDYARQTLTSVAALYSNPNIPDNDGKPLHIDPNLNRFETNIDALADLYWLAMSKRLFVMGSPKNRLSGYSRLAGRLSSRKRIATNLMGRMKDPVDWRHVKKTYKGVPVWRVHPIRLFSRKLHLVHPYPFF